MKVVPAVGSWGVNPGPHRPWGAPGRVKTSVCNFQTQESRGLCTVQAVPLLPAAPTLLSTPEYQATPYFLKKKISFF